MYDDDDGRARDLTLSVGTVGIDFADRQQRMHESGDEQADGELTGPVPQETLNDPGRELAHGELYDHQHDRQHEYRQVHHRSGHRRQDRHRRLRPSDQRWGQESIVVCPVERDRGEGEADPHQDTEDRDQPQARRDVLVELVEDDLHAGGPVEHASARRVRGDSASGGCVNPVLQTLGVDDLPGVRSAKRGEGVRNDNRPVTRRPQGGIGNRTNRFRIEK